MRCDGFWRDRVTLTIQFCSAIVLFCSLISLTVAFQKILSFRVFLSKADQPLSVCGEERLTMSAERSEVSKGQARLEPLLHCA